MTYKKRGPPGWHRRASGNVRRIKDQNNSQVRALQPHLQAYAVAWLTRR